MGGRAGPKHGDARGRSVISCLFKPIYLIYLLNIYLHWLEEKSLGRTVTTPQLPLCGSKQEYALASNLQCLSARQKVCTQQKQFNDHLLLLKYTPWGAHALLLQYPRRLLLYYKHSVLTKEFHETHFCLGTCSCFVSAPFQLASFPQF